MSKLITYAYLRIETDISKNVENEVLDNPIKWAHDQLKFMLGRQLYDEVYAQGITLPTTFSTNNAALFDPYIKQFLAWTAYADYIIKANSYETRTGVRVYKEDNSDPASDQTMNMRIKKAADKAQFYKGAMINYIEEQQNLSTANFPLYIKDCSNRKFGTGFGISGVKKLSTSQKDITQRTIQNGY
jgi:hypothetical protein